MTDSTNDLIKRLREAAEAKNLHSTSIAALVSLLREAADAIEALERTVAELEGLLREIRPQVDIVRGSWFDRTDAILARLDGSKP